MLEFPWQMVEDGIRRLREVGIADMEPQRPTGGLCATGGPMDTLFAEA